MGVEGWKLDLPSVVTLDPPVRYNVPQYNALFHHEMALLPIKYKVIFFASHQDQRETVQTLLKRWTEDREVIHENLKEMFCYVRKDTDHAPLKSGKCTT